LPEGDVDDLQGFSRAPGRREKKRGGGETPFTPLYTWREKEGEEESFSL